MIANQIYRSISFLEVEEIQSGQLGKPIRISVSLSSRSIAFSNLHGQGSEWLVEKNKKSFFSVQPRTHFISLDVSVNPVCLCRSVMRPDFLLSAFVIENTCARSIGKEINAASLEIDAFKIFLLRVDDCSLWMPLLFEGWKSNYRVKSEYATDDMFSKVLWYHF